MDLPSRAKWYEYSRARDAMLKATDTQARAVVHRPLRRQEARAPQHHRAPAEADSVQEGRAAEGEAAQSFEEACLRRRGDARAAQVRSRGLLSNDDGRATRSGRRRARSLLVAAFVERRRGPSPPSAALQRCPAAFARLAPAVLQAEPSEPVGDTSRSSTAPSSMLRARVLGRGPAERAEGAEQRARRSSRPSGITGPVEWRAPSTAASLISVASQGVLVLTPPTSTNCPGRPFEDVDGADRRAPAQALAEAEADASGAVGAAARRRQCSGRAGAGAGARAGRSRARPPRVCRPSSCAVAEQTVAPNRTRRRRLAARLAVARVRARRH